MKMKRILYALIFVFTLSLSAPAFASAAGITPAEIDKMAIDPQNWKLHRDMTRDEIKPNPVIDWHTELNKDGLDVQTTYMTAKGRKIHGALILVEYLDRKFISGNPKGNDPLGYKLFNTNLVGDDGKKHGSYQANISKNAVTSILDYSSKYPGGYAELPQFWADFLTVPNYNDHQKPINYGATVDAYWLENSYGKWGAELVPHGIFTVPYFEFELMSSYQNYTDVPPTFRYGTPDQANPGTSGSGSTRSNSVDNHACEVAKRGGVLNLLSGETENPWGIPAGTRGLRSSTPVNYDDYDFYFLLHAGYAESGAWQEFGQLQFATRQDVPWELGPGPRLLKAEKFFNDYPEWVPVYAARYENGWANYTGEWRTDKHDGSFAVLARVAQYRSVAFWKETLDKWRIKYDSTHPSYNPSATFEFKLPQEDWDWANAYHGKSVYEGATNDNSIWDGLTDYVGLPHHRNTRYVDFTSWEAAVGEWSHSQSRSGGNNYGQTGGTKTTIPGSCQAENSGMATFAHEFGHIASISDNYGNPWERLANPATEPWDIMSRGSFGGPFGDHARWTTMPIEGGSVPTLGTYHPRNIWKYFDAGDIYEIDIDKLAERTPVVANVVGRNIPLNNTNYPNLNVPKYNPDTGLGFVKGIRVNFNVSADTASSDQSVRTRGYTNFHSMSATGTNTDSASTFAKHMALEVVDQTGNDSFCHDTGVLLSRVYNLTNAGHTIVDSHIYDIAMTDYYLGGEPSIYTIGHATQLADGLFKVGKSMTDTGYYKAIRDAADNIVKAGSEWRWEARDGRSISGGDTVNEWRDEANKLHFYVLEKKEDPAKYGKLLSYKVGLRHDDGESVNGKLSLSVKPGGEATAVDIGNYTKQTYLLTNTGATGTDIVRVKLAGKLSEGRFADETVDLTVRSNTTPTPTLLSGTRSVPKFFSEQNAVILNDLYAVAPGETVEFDVYIKQTDKDLMGNLADLLTVIVESESNSSNRAELSVDGKTEGGDDTIKDKIKDKIDDLLDEAGCNAGYGLAFMVLALVPVIFKKK